MHLVALQTAANLDFWSERTIRDVKVIGGHVSKDPEKTYTNAVSTSIALSTALRKHPDSSLQRVHDLIQGPATVAERDGVQYDVGTATAMLIGSGSQPTVAERAQLGKLVRAHVRGLLEINAYDALAQFWTPDAIATAIADKKVVPVYERASINGHEIVRVEGAFTGRARQNCWVFTLRTSSPEMVRNYVENSIPSTFG